MADQVDRGRDAAEGHAQAEPGQQMRAVQRGPMHDPGPHTVVWMIIPRRG